MKKRIWLTWEIQRRNRSMSSDLNAKLYEITSNASWWKRYPLLIFITIKKIIKSKPSLIFVQNPSLILSAIIVIYGKITQTVIVVDAHNAGVFPLEGRYKILNQIVGFVNSLATKVIVSNHALKQYIHKNNNSVFAIPDPVPKIFKNDNYNLNGDKFNIVFICSWAADEPYEAVFSIADNLTDATHIYITGNSKGKERNIKKDLPLNITLTGFLSNEKYDDLIHACDAVMVLTKRDNCLVCGAYEGVAVEKPMILSKTNILISHFNKGCVYTDNTSSNIEYSINKLIADYSNLSRDIIILKKELKLSMETILLDLNTELEKL